MSGSLTGHGAAWPLPTVLSGALHAALWRSEIPSHAHRRGRSGNWNDGQRDRRFGSLFSAGPFPEQGGTWFFPRPADAQKAGSTAVTLRPHPAPTASSLPRPLTCCIANTEPPNKCRLETWISREAWRRYLTGEPLDGPSNRFLWDSDFCDPEYSIGIGIDPDTGTQNEVQFYTAHYLRLQPGWRLACLAEARDKEHNGQDIIPRLIHSEGGIIVGGQQRVCSATLIENVPPNLPVGSQITGIRVKWVLITPAIFPKIGNHPGGFLPSWVNHQTGQVELLDGPGKNAASRRGEPEGKPISARLVAALTGKPIPVTGYALPFEAIGSQGGAKPSHLAVPAGAVYYFEADSATEARKLADALNWHGATPGTEIRNRRSTLMGEKGFGLGVCGTWQPHSGTPSQ
jgi:CRISPR type III-B/RAMP module-associated protein Cmr3